MAKNALATGGKKQFVEVTTIIKSEPQRARLQGYIDEVLRCKVKILDHNEAIKGIQEAAIDDLNIDPKMFKQLISLFFNNNFSQKKEELERLEAAINALMQVGTNVGGTTDGE